MSTKFDEPPGTSVRLENVADEQGLATTSSKPPAQLASWLWPDDASHRVPRLLCALSSVLLAMLTYQVVRRVVFPWDLYIWSETQVMTNMMKLSEGKSLFNPPSDVNSFVYSPGLEYLCYALLAPFGAHLDVRACRFVAILLALVASASVANISSYVYSSVSDADFASDAQAAHRRALRFFAFSATTLIIFHNFTADVCHPDNLFICHAMVSLYLLMRAVVTGSYRAALIAVAFSAMAILAKQTAALGGIGVLGALYILNRSRWSAKQQFMALAVSAGVYLASVGLLASTENSRFYMFELLMQHSLAIHRAVEILRSMGSHPHRLILVILAAMSFFRLAGSASPRIAPLLLCWAAVGFEVLPALAAYLKVMATWNNLTVVDVWLAALAIPGSWQAVANTYSSANVRHADGAVIAGLLAVLTLFVIPLKLPPTKGQYAFGTALDDYIREDIQAKRRILLPHGTAPLIHAGIVDAPLDRSVAVLESAMARSGVPDTRERIEQRYYIRIYMFCADWYGPQILSAIERNYHEVAVIPGDQTPGYADDYLAGYQNHMRAPVRIMEVN